MNKNIILIFTIASLLCIGLSSCSKQEDNTLTSKEKEEGWQLLFDGKTTDGWHLYHIGKKPSAWIVREGVLYCDPANTEAEHGDLLTDKEYTNYEFEFEWKLSDGGNSGVFINVQEKDSIPTAWASGPEYQLLDGSHHDYEKIDKRSGCLYGFASQKNAVEPKANHEWNQSLIKQVNGKIEFYLNGVLTAEQDLTTDEWKQKVQTTGFKHFPEFGKYTSGRIALQDWAKGVSFRNIKIKEL